MSADDFQTKYATVMESMLQSAVAETTKLFETMVDELRAEISKMKEENEDLKARCSLFERAKSEQTVFPGESSPYLGLIGTQRRDTAVQCDLASYSVLVEQFQPLSYSQWDEQKRHSCESIVNPLQEHDYESSGDGNLEITFTPIKQELEEFEFPVVCGHDSDIADSPSTSCGIENVKPLSNTPCSKNEMAMLQRHEDTQRALELPFLGTDAGLQRDQSSEIDHPSVISLAEVKEDMEEESEVGLMISEIRTLGELMTSEKHQLFIAQHQSEETLDQEQPSVVSQQFQSKDKLLGDEQIGALQHCSDVHSTEEQLGQPTPLKKGDACNELNGPVAQVEASSQSGVVRLRRGRPPKTAKRLQQRIREKHQSQSSDVPTEQHISSPQESPVLPLETLTVISSLIQENENIKVVSQAASLASPYSTNLKEDAIQALPSDVSAAVETVDTLPAVSPQAPLVQSAEFGTSVTLQDALLLVEAMNQSMVDDAVFSTLRTEATLRTLCGPHVGALNIMETTAQTLPMKTDDAEVSTSITELLTKQILCAPCQTADVTPASEVKAAIKIITPKQQYTVDLPDENTSLMSPATLRVVQALQKDHSHPLVASTQLRRQGYTAPHKIIVVPRSLSSIKAQAPNHQSDVVSTLVTLQHTVPCSTAALLSLGTSSLSPDPKKTLNTTSNKTLPAVPKPTTTTSNEPKSVALFHQPTDMTPRQGLATASRKNLFESVQSAQQDSKKSSASAMVSTSQESNISASTKTTMWSAERNYTPDVLEFVKNTSVSRKKHPSTETCARFNKSARPVPPPMSQAVPPPFEQRRIAVLRLSRLPIALSTKESVFVSKQTSDVSWNSHLIVKKDSSKAKSSSLCLSTESEGTLELSTKICLELKDTSVAVSLNKSQMAEEPNDIEEKVSLSFESCTTLKKSSTLTKGSPPEPTTMGINATEPLAAQEGAFPTDQPKEEKQPATLLHPGVATSEETLDPCSQLAKHQFMAQLPLLPVARLPQKPSSNASRASCAGSNLSENQMLLKLRSHIKSHLRARRTKTDAGSLTGTSPKKPKLDKDNQNVENTIREDMTLSARKTGEVEDLTHTIIGPRISRCKDDAKPKGTAGEISFINSKRSKSNIVSTLTNPQKLSSVGEGVGSQKKSTPRRTSSAKESSIPNNIRNISLRTRKVSSTRNDPSPRNRKTGGSLNNTQTTSGRPKRTPLSKVDASPKKIKSTPVSPKICGSSENGTSPKMSTNASTSVISRRFTFTKNGSCTSQAKGESKCCNPQSCNTTTDDAFTTNTNSHVRDITLAKNGLSIENTWESTSLKKQSLIRDCTRPKNNSGVMNIKTLAKTKAVVKIKNRSLRGADINQLAASHVSCRIVRKSKAVWIPPELTASKTPPAGEQKTVESPVQRETKYAGPKVYPHSVPVQPIPFKAPPVVSPLQPLSVIGRRLLKNQCGECGRVFSSSLALESHVSLHTGRRPFSCTLCGKFFSDSQCLKRHGRVHRNGRIHVCQQCGKGFVYKFGLTKHIRTVHRRFKPFVCQICNKGCFTKLEVEAHIRIHTGEKPFHCNLCEKKFARRGDLNVHLRWHNGEKRHWCQYCGKGFLEFNNLKRHKYIHTGEKPHSCPHCPKHFTQSGHLKKHVKNVHGIQ